VRTGEPTRKLMEERDRQKQKESIEKSIKDMEAMLQD